MSMPSAFRHLPDGFARPCLDLTAIKGEGDFLAHLVASRPLQYANDQQLGTTPNARPSHKRRI